MGKQLGVLAVVALVLAGTATAQIDPASVTTGHVYLFEEIVGTTVPDDSANTNDGTIVGDPQLVDALKGKGLQFDGVDDQVTIPDSGNINTGGPFPNRTVIAMFKCDDVDKEGKQTIFEEGGRTRGAVIYVFEGQVYVGAWNRAEYNWNGEWISAPIGSDEWHAVSFVIRDASGAVEDDKFEMWMDGQLIESRSGGQLHGHGDDTGIGATNQNVVFHDDDGSGSGRDFFGGVIDEVWILNDALTPEELAGFVGRKVPTAVSPDPGDGAMVEDRRVNLSWRPGAFAVSHDVYFGESFDDVNEGAADTFLGNQTAESLFLGLPGQPYGDGLTPGQTYYWRIDEVNDANAASPWKGKIWSFRVRPLNAWNPIPADAMRFVDPNQDLTWEPGLGNLFHTVFFGQSFEEVDTAATGAMVSEATYDPGTLEENTTYYWRVDQFSFPGNITTKGDVWSFTTVGPGGGVKAEYFTGMTLSGEPLLTQIEDQIDHDWGQEAVVEDLTDQVSARWTADLEAPLTGTYDLITTSDDGVRLWLDGLLVINNWTNHAATDNKATVDLQAGEIYSVQMEWYEDGGGAVAQLSWESPFIARQFIPRGALQPPMRAGVPSPGNGEVDVAQTLTLGWLAGEGATEHLIYFGDDAEAVANATDPDARQAAANTGYSVGTLEWNKTYYWRVDEVQSDGSVLQGKVWSFTTADFLAVDNFESYTNDSPNRVFQTWVDGLGFSPDPNFPDGDPGNGSGAIVGYDPLAGDIMETSIVNSGQQSMPVAYDNTFAPGFSQTDRTFAPPQNWTADGVTTLVIHFRGEADNAGQLYAEINGTRVDYPGDPADIASRSWIAWEIDLASVGTNLTSVTMLSIGVEGGETGTLYIDDVRLTRP